jgi:hypothetical protein
MPQHEQLHLLGGSGAAQQQDQPKHLPDDHLSQPQRHPGDRARVPEHSHPLLAGLRDILEPHRLPGASDRIPAGGSSSSREASAPAVGHPGRRARHSMRGPRALRGDGDDQARATRLGNAHGACGPARFAGWRGIRLLSLGVIDAWPGEGRSHHRCGRVRRPRRVSVGRLPISLTPSHSQTR